MATSSKKPPDYSDSPLLPPRNTSSRAGSFISLFAGCGGLSLGLMNAGWRGILAVEKDPHAFATFSNNLLNDPNGIGFEWPSWLPESPCEIASFLENYRDFISDLRGKIDLVAGGPPCQGFSLAGKRDENDPRNKLYKYYTEVVRLVQPPFILVENVRGITIEFGKGNYTQQKETNGEGSGIPYSERIKRDLDELGYRVYGNLINAVDFGVPQHRKRYFLFGVKKSMISEGQEIDPFSMLHRERKRFLFSKGLPIDRPNTTREAISDLEVRGSVLTNCEDSPGFTQIVFKGARTDYQRLLYGDMDIVSPNSLRLVNHSEKIIARFAKIQSTCRKGVQLSVKDRKRLGINKHTIVPLDGDKPSHTITTLPDDLLHYSEPRVLTVRESARLQSFPDWFEFKGKYTTGGHLRVHECPRYTQVGNAVPPLLAEIIGLVLSDLKSELA
ncbi:MAG: DNA cytosine methyltransferase [Candidatus Marinimicrobia bacterium]|nr:DNA cytosine methyltransferase [Candidatus Neomarinimicrobiota bacterium]